jgi:DNA-binding GntR family transcriptional regulator
MQIIQLTRYSVCGIPVAMESLVLMSTKDQVVNSLVKEITSGSFKPREPLYERTLAEELGISRTPVREALYDLQKLGFVEKKSRIGWHVAVPDVQSVTEIIDLRKILEISGLIRLLENGTDETITETASYFDDFSKENIHSRIEEYLVNDGIFHKSFIKATDNSRIIEIYENIALLSNWIRHLISYEEKTRRIQRLEEHCVICNNIKKRNVSAAIEALGGHLDRVGREYLTLIEKQEDW